MPLTHEEARERNRLRMAAKAREKMKLNKDNGWTKKGFLGGGVCVVGWCRLLLVLVLMVLVVQNGQLTTKQNNLRQEVLVLHEQIARHKVDFHALMADKKSMKIRVENIEKFLEPVLVTEKEVTAYAPLDVDAVSGVCKDNTPNVTASGEPPVPGRTAAAGRSVPFGTMVFVLGRGWYRVNDRGGAVGNDDIDVVTETRDEALRFGRRTLPVMVVPAE